ncbi:reverse transcriptase domain, reverse transcriptase zinc-binding domain protein [Tanacetum coccineum]
MERGLRQGDPLTPFLFLLVAKALQVTILDACNKGLKVNLSKSRLFGVRVDLSKVEVVASSLNCSHDAIPFLYLGLPVGKNIKYCDGWLDVIRRVQDRLSSWKARSLSIGGRLTLIKSVLGSIPLYYLSIFNALLKNLVLKDQNKGGLRVGSLLAKNLGLRALENIPYGEIISSIDYIDGLDVSFSSSFSKKESNGFDNRQLADSSIDPQLRWNSWIPRKINVCVWRASLDMLPSQVNLIARGVDIPSYLCPFCEAEDESLDHSLSISDIAMGKIGNLENEILNCVLHEVYMCVLWSIWKWRNNLVHASSELVESVRSFDIFPSIQRLSKMRIPHVDNEVVVQKVDLQNKNDVDMSSARVQVDTNNDVENVYDETVMFMSSKRTKVTYKDPNGDNGKKSDA